MGLLAVVLAVLMLPSHPGLSVAPATTHEEQTQSQPQTKSTAEGQQQSQQESAGPQSKPQPPPPPPPKPDSTRDDGLFSIDRLRQDLERQPTVTFIIPDPNMPRFKVEVEGKRWELPTLQQRMAKAIPKMAVQVPFGGTLASDMTRLNTPPQFMGSAGFTNREVVSMAAVAAETWLGKTMVKKALEARHNAAAAQMREQIRQELADVEAHNARVAAGLSDGDGTQDPKKTDKKKQDQKKPVKKKKKDGQAVDRRP